jgi:glycogen(starch) synthase
MLRACPSLRLLLAGSGPHEEQLKARAEQLGVAAKVTFANRVANHYAQIDLLVYPRLQMPLTELLAPAKPLQAMAHGRLVVASNIGAHRELIEHGKTGILFEPGSASGLADAVLSLLTEPGCWQPLGDAARAFVARERSWAACAARCAPLYTALLERKRTR